MCFKMLLIMTNLAAVAKLRGNLHFREHLHIMQSKNRGRSSGNDYSYIFYIGFLAYFYY